MKCFSTLQIRQLDNLTLKREGIIAIDLMNRAAHALFQRITAIATTKQGAVVLCGPGNNGGDGLAVAGLLHKQGYRVQAVLCNYGKPLTVETQHQLEKVQQLDAFSLLTPISPSELETLSEADWLIDALFGSGLNRPLEGYFADTVDWMNRQPGKRLSIDLPSGLTGENNGAFLHTSVVKANLTLGLQCPRLAFLLPENEAFVGEWSLVDIGLDASAMSDIQTPWSLTTANDAAAIVKIRPRFAHKGEFGRALLIAGSPGMTGAAILAGKGALRAGVGLLTLKIPEACLSVVQTALPEATAVTYKAQFCEPTANLSTWSAIGVGPGLGTDGEHAAALNALFDGQPDKLVLDADALNVIAANPSLLSKLPANSILTPHPGEFDRLVGMPHSTGYDRLQAACHFCERYGCYMVLKGAHSACIQPSGDCQFNNSGNPGMATGGSGDVLTGIIVSLLAQGYTHEEACVLGCYLHGLSADLALEQESQESLIASDIVTNLGRAYHYLKHITQHPL